MKIQSLRIFLRNLVSARSALRLLETFGGLWLLLEVTAFFSADAANKIRPFWWAFLLLGLGIAAWGSIPRLRRRCKLNERDVCVELVVGDIFEEPGDLVVGSNTTFDTETHDNLISPSSIQGKFTLKHFPARSDLDSILDRELDGKPHETVQKRGKTKRYPIGTVCSLATSSYTSYWVAIADLNPHGAASGSFQKLRDALPELWQHIAERGSRSSIRLPVLGSGFSRIHEPRSRIIKEMIRSFIAACSESSFCEHLLIFIHPKDFVQHEIDLDEIERFLIYQCAYTDFAAQGDRGAGTGIS